MLIHLAADHRGHDRGRALQRELEDRGHEVSWHGADELDPGDDYPHPVIAAVKAVVADEDAGRPSRGVVAAGDGTGELVAANKVNGGRATLAVDVDQVVAARTRADVNVLVVPATLDADLALRLVETLVDTGFSSELDDARRLLQIAEYESAGTIEGWQVGGASSGEATLGLPL